MSIWHAESSLPSSPHCLSVFFVLLVFALLSSSVLFVSFVLFVFTLLS